MVPSSLFAFPTSLFVNLTLNIEDIVVALYPQICCRPPHNTPPPPIQRTPNSKWTCIVGPMAR